MAESGYVVLRANNTTLILHFSLLFGVLAISFTAALNGKLNLSYKVKGDDLSDFVSKLQFTFMYQTLGVLWLTFNMGYIGFRFRAMVGTDEKWNPSEHFLLALERYRNIMANSLEQLVISCFAQYILLTHLDGDQVVQFIPLMNVLFFVGRVAFWFGYPSKRTFGFCLSWLPTVAAVVYSIFVFFWKFMQSKNITS